MPDQHPDLLSALLKQYAPQEPQGDNSLSGLLSGYGNTPFPESGSPQPSEGGRPMAWARSYEPTWRDRLAAYLAGDEQDPIRRKLAQGLLGSTGLGPTTDPEAAAWRKLPVAGPLIDATQSAYNDQHGRTAVHLLDAVGEGWLAGNAKNILMNAMAKPPLPAYETFRLPIMNPKTGTEGGYVIGHVAGDSAHINGAYREGRIGAEGANSIGYREMRRVFDALREQYPNTSNVTAKRVSGARKGKAAPYADAFTKEPVGRKAAMGALDTVDMLAPAKTSEKAYEALGPSSGINNLNVELTPLWQQILNEAGRRGVR